MDEEFVCGFNLFKAELLNKLDRFEKNVQDEELQTPEDWWETFTTFVEHDGN